MLPTGQLGVGTVVVGSTQLGIGTQLPVPPSDTSTQVKQAVQRTCMQVETAVVAVDILVVVDNLVVVPTVRVVVSAVFVVDALVVVPSVRVVLDAVWVFSECVVVVTGQTSVPQLR